MKTELTMAQIAEVKMNQEIQSQLRRRDAWAAVGLHELTDDRAAEHEALSKSRLARTVKIRRHILP